MTDETKDLIPAQPTSVTPAKPAEPANHAQWLALYIKGRLDEREFQAHAGLSVAEATEALSEEGANEVQREMVRLRASTEFARLRAADLTEKAVEVADEVMSDPEMHAGQRLAAADFIRGTASGKYKPGGHREGASEKFSITINIPREDGSLERVVDIEATPVISTEGDQ